MKGTAVAFGAVSIVNAIPEGHGVAMSVDLALKSEVTIRPRSHGIVVSIDGASRENPSLVEGLVRGLLRRLGLRGGAVVSTTSSIPISRGLKSSSAAASATALALCHAAGRSLPEIELLTLGARAARQAGVSITGAFDDACASFFGGICAADNSRRTMLHHTRAPDDLRVVLHVPGTKLRKVKLDVARLRAFRDAARAVFQMAEAGDYWRAMTLNGLIVAAALGLDSGPMCAALRDGAMGAGISGTGPATAAICEPAQAPRIAEALRPFGGRVLQVRPNNRRAFVVT